MILKDASPLLFRPTWNGEVISKKPKNCNEILYGTEQTTKEILNNYRLLLYCSLIQCRKCLEIVVGASVGWLVGF